MGNCASAKKEKITQREHPIEKKQIIKRKQPMIHKITYGAARGELRQNYDLNGKKGDGKLSCYHSGEYAKVFKVINVHDKKFVVAMKDLSKYKLGSKVHLYAHELDVLSKLDHPNIIKHYETYNDQYALTMIMECFKGESLYSNLTRKNNEPLSEVDSLQYMKQLFSAIKHCHASGIIHRDLRP